jgi:hypothetical protein
MSLVAEGSLATASSPFKYWNERCAITLRRPGATGRRRKPVFERQPTLYPVDNKEPKPFIWTKSARDILQQVTRTNSRLSSKQNAH